MIGKLTLNRNPDNFFAETEQVAFCPGHIVPGLDFTNDPLLQGRLFSYTDTQISRLGGPDFHEIPINRPLAPLHNGQCDAMHRQTIDKGQAFYEPNSIDDGWPRETAPVAGGGFETYTERVGARGRREDLRAQSVVQGSLFAGHAVLEQHDGAGEGSHRGRMLVRTEQGGAQKYPRASVGYPRQYR